MKRKMKTVPCRGPGSRGEELGLIKTTLVVVCTEHRCVARIEV